MKHAVLLNIIVYILLNLYCIILQNSAKTIFLIFFLYLQLLSTLRIKVPKPSSYHEAKQAAVEYHTAKQTLIKAFHKAGLGAWVKKPIEQDQFSLNSWRGNIKRPGHDNNQLLILHLMCGDVCVCVMLFVLRQTKSPLVSVILLSLCES